MDALILLIMLIRCSGEGGMNAYLILIEEKAEYKKLPSISQTCLSVKSRAGVGKKTISTFCEYSPAAKRFKQLSALWMLKDQKLIGCCFPNKV